MFIFSFQILSLGKIKNQLPGSNKSHDMSRDVAEQNHVISQKNSEIKKKILKVFGNLYNFFRLRNFWTFFKNIKFKYKTCVDVFYVLEYFSGDEILFELWDFCQSIGSWKFCWKCTIILFFYFNFFFEKSRDSFHLGNRPNIQLVKPMKERRESKSYITSFLKLFIIFLGVSVKFVTVSIKVPKHVALKKRHYSCYYK